MQQQPETDHRREVTWFLAGVAATTSWAAAAYGADGDWAAFWLLVPVAAICTVAAMLGAALGEPS